MIVDINDYRDQEKVDWTYKELLCIKCGYRWIGILPRMFRLIDVECPQCKKQGLTVDTGEDILNCVEMVEERIKE